MQREGCKTNFMCRKMHAERQIIWKIEKKRVILHCFWLRQQPES
jgi:hypothetical protein